jgi:hypothetical protein
MTLTKKQLKHYKKLVQNKLIEMGIKDDIQYTKTGHFKTVKQFNPESGRVEERRVDSYRAANLYSSLCKKILSLPPEGVERFLAVNTKPKETDGNQIQETPLNSAD